MYSMFFECLPSRLGMPKVHGLNHAWCLNQGFGNNEAFRKSPCDNCRQPVGRHVCWSPLDPIKAWCTRCKGHWDRHREPRSAERVARSVALDTLEEFSYCPQGCGRQMMRAKDGVPIPQDLLDQGVRTVACYPPLQSLVCKPCFNKLYKLDKNEADRSKTKHCACGNEISKASMFSGLITCGQCVFKRRLEKLESETDDETCALCPLKLSRSERVYARGRTPEGGKICGQCAANKRLKEAEGKVVECIQCGKPLTRSLIAAGRKVCDVHILDKRLAKMKAEKEFELCGDCDEHSSDAAVGRKRIGDSGTECPNAPCSRTFRLSHLEI